jgi:hypothetical protein
MLMNEIVIEQLNRIVRTCEQAIYETEMAVGDPERGYPYASGYSRMALKDVLNDVQFILKNANN